MSAEQVESVNADAALLLDLIKRQSETIVSLSKRLEKVTDKLEKVTDMGRLLADEVFKERLFWAPPYGEC